MGTFNELEETSEVSLQDILINMLDGEKDLDLKTHIHKPKQLSALFILKNYLKTNQCKVSSKIVDDFIKQYLRYMVSFDRLSRTEIVKAITSALDREIEAKQNNSEN